ncbi:MAG: TetR/AcrR family transcriptional regulator C-terminal domain-containing protein [Chloroflexi bacterium]|jgi:AcrR family transcriptional regulator|nr:TetR/AcrR family transcriptional regulator C-terminal domain-containing protein [Chloroflexota bacterium]
MSRVPRADRLPLSRERILAAALEVLDADGLEGLTMRRLADTLGVGAMSLYRHVTDRDDLLDLVVEGILAETEIPASTGGWRTDLEAIARAARVGLLRHRGATVLVTTRLGLGRGGLAAVERTLGVLRAAGFDDATAVAANRALGNLVAGAVLYEAAGLGGAQGDDRARRRDQGRALMAALPEDEFPNLRAAAGAMFAVSADAAFDAGLAALLDGFEGLLARGHA